MTKFIERVRTAWSVLRGSAGSVGTPSGMKKSPYAWMTWQQGVPRWQLGDFQTYVQQGYEINALIFAAISYKERAIGGVPMRAYTGDSENPERLPPTHPLARLAMRPNPYQSFLEFQRQRVVYLNIAGNCYTYIDRDSGGEIIALYNLRPDRVMIIPDSRGGLKGYAYRQHDAATWNDSLLILPSDLMHKKFTHPLDEFEGLGYGLSPLAPMAQSADVDNAVTGFLKTFFEQGAAVQGLLKFNVALDDESVARVRRRWKEIYGGAQHWDEVGVLDEGAEYQRVALTFNEMGFEAIDSRNEARVLMPFGVPPILIGTRSGLARSTMANYEESRRQCWEDTLLPELELIEADDQYYLQSADGGYVMYDRSKVAALRQDVVPLVGAAHTLWTMGVPANQAFAAVGLRINDVPGGNVPYVPMAVQTPGATAEAVVANDGIADVSAATDEVRARGQPGEGKSDDRKAAQAEAVDRIAVSHEREFAKAAATEFDRELREISSLVTKAKRTALETKSTVNWVEHLKPTLDYITAGGENWRSTFAPLVAGVVGDAASFWQSEAGLAFDVRNLEAEDWFTRYMATFAGPITDTSRDTLSEIFQRATREGWTIEQMQKALDLTFRQWISGNVAFEDLAFALARLPAHRTEMIARTETMRAYAAGSWQIYAKNGIDVKEWFATGDDRTRPEHRAAHGQRRKIGEAFIVGAARMMHPLDGSLGAPVGQIVNCRCALLPVFAGDPETPPLPPIDAPEPMPTPKPPAESPYTVVQVGNDEPGSPIPPKPI